MHPLYYRPPQVNEYLSCRRKRRFKTRVEAQRAHAKHRLYECPHCGGWHLTSKPERKPRR